MQCFDEWHYRGRRIRQCRQETYGGGQQAISRLEDRFDPPAETEFTRMLRVRIEAGRRPG